ncbi:MAG: type II secretion system F family protein [Bryobacteraceae bacterium]
MIPVFLLTTLTSMATMALAMNWQARREHALALRRLAGKATAKAAGQPSVKPLLMQVAGEVRGRLATRALERLKLKEAVERMLETADLKWGAAGLLHRSAAACLGAALAAMALTANSLPLLTAAAGLLAAMVPVKLAQRKARGRVRKFEEQFPDCLEFIARSMRAGHAFSVSLEMVHKEFGEPLAGEFRRTFEEQNLGQPLDIVLKKLGRRIPSLDVQFFVSAVLLQKRTGGNLAELLDKLAHIIRERFKLRARVRAISAQGLMSGRILAAIPVVVGALMFVVNPRYARFLVDDPAGRELLAGGLGLQALGYLIIRKIVTIEV